MSSPGFSWQFPPDGNSPEEAIAFIFRQLLAKVDTIKAVKVIAVHPGQGTPPAEGTVDVQILVNQIDGDTPPNSTPHTTVYGLPYWRLGAGTWAIVADPVVGDLGLALCCDRDISTVKSSMAQANPGSQRRYNVADGIFIGLILAASPTSYLWLQTNGFKLSDPNSNMIQGTSNGIAITPAGGILTVNGQVQATGDVIANSGASQVSLANHTQSGVTTGSDDSGPPVPGT